VKGTVNNVSNLGTYQWLTTTAKKVGGPKKLIAIIAGSGVVVYKGGEILVKKVVKVIKKQSDSKSEIKSDIKLYVTKISGISNEGIRFDINDRFRVLEEDGDSVLVEKIGDDNNPYYISVDFLQRISDYKK